MSEDVVIRAQGLSKKYLISHQAEQERYTSLRDVLAAKAKGVLRREGAKATAQEEFWALRDLDFEIRRGEVVGVIGRNGAGKSTLLKVLSRITEPTSGRVEIRGRVASLLEVGTGFHPELTGRENIFLNGAILGMSRAEIRRKFDEIVAFAEVEKFLDTPVKRYSSGMYVRLAFSVAAHLEPEILVVDEVLAVGDAEFQKKCLGKMQDVAGHGRTVLFVSHNIPTVQTLCESAIFLQNGVLRDRGPVSAVCETYRTQGDAARSFAEMDLLPRRQSTRNLRVKSLSMKDAENQPIARPHTGQDVSFILQLEGQAASARPVRAELHVFSLMGAPLMICATEASASGRMVAAGGDKLVCRIPRLPLVAGRYKIGLFMECNGVIEEWIEDGLILDVDDASFFGSGRNMPGAWHGNVPITDHVWTRIASDGN